MKQILLNEIADRGPLPFERFMQLALYHPEGGFFGAGSLRSVKAGDFLTSPEVSPLFGEAIAAMVEAERQRVGDPFRLVEVAAGSGSLLASLLNTIDVEAWAVEASLAARTALNEVIDPDRVVESFDQIPSPFAGVILANELIDNLPMAIAQMVQGEWRERWVGADKGALVLIDADPRPEVEAWLARFAGPVPDGGMVEVQLAASGLAAVGDGPAHYRVNCAL